MAYSDEGGAALQLGGVSFLNAQPLLHGILSGLGAERVRLQLAEPAVLTRMLFEDELDAALAPVAPLALHGGLQVVPQVAIGCDGPVRSVLLVGERPLHEVDEVLLDGASRTSVILSRLVLQHLRGGSEPRYCARPAPEVVKGVGGKTGGLVIGDIALEVAARFPHVVDLGAAWKSMTGLPFVFALWIARPDVLNAQDVELLQASARAGLAARRDIAERWARGRGGVAAAHEAYLTESIAYDFGDLQRAGLQEFLARAAAARLLPKCELRFAVGGAGYGGSSRPPRERAFSRVIAGERLSLHDAQLLSTSADPKRLVTLADERALRVPPGMGDMAHLQLVRESAGTRRPATRDELVAQVRTLVDNGVERVALQGPLRDGIHLEWFENLLRSLRQVGGVQVHALTPDHIVTLAAREDLSLPHVVDRLAAAGLSAVLGTGASVLTDRVRQARLPGATSSSTFLDVLRLCHRRDMKTWVAMEFGALDSGTDRLLHLMKLRDLQDETGGLLGLWLTPDPDVPSMEAPFYLSVVTLARLVLDNVPSIRVPHDLKPNWLEQALRHGADGVYGRPQHPAGITCSGVRPIGSGAAPEQEP